MLEACNGSMDYIIVRCHNLSITELPLDGNEVNTFKGICAIVVCLSACWRMVRNTIFFKEIFMLIKEQFSKNLIADIFSKMGRKLYYFHKDSGL